MEKQFQFSDKLIKTIVTYSSGFFSADNLDKLITSFEAETKNYYFTSESESNLHRIFNSVLDKVTLFKNCLKYPLLVEVLIALSASSNYLTDIIVRNPEFIYLVFTDNFFHSKLEREKLDKEVSGGINRFKTFDAKVGHLRLLKRKYLLKIGLKDILHLCSFEETIDEISVLAYSINSNLFDLCYTQICRNNNADVKTNNYALISLGKMGGCELNYSSDIDLMLFFNKNSKVKNTKKDYYEILFDSIQLYTSMASSITEGGFLYRVDFRLRPDGSSSPLCRSLNDTITYYETRGEQWEKQMLIKANFLSGNKLLYNTFDKFRRSHIFSTSASLSPLDKIKRMKQEIEKHHPEESNVKTFWGGIRDIEFSVQALQLINGSKNKKLQSANTLDTIKALSELKIITKDEAKELNDAYIFFRKIEHFLQLMNNKQTHQIPNDQYTQNQLRNYLGFPSIKKFDNALLKHRQNVRNIFNSIFGESENSRSESNSTTIKYLDKKRAEKNLNFLQLGTGLANQKSFDTRTIELFTKIEDTLKDYLSSAHAPDKVLENFVKLISVSKIPSIMYSEFQNKTFFKKVLTVCERSQIAIDSLMFNKSLIDLLISRKVFAKNISDILDELKFDELKFILTIQFALDLIDPKNLSLYLSQYYKNSLSQISSELEIDTEFFLAGLGSFGIGEMNFNSDVDLIVVVDKITDRSKLERTFQKFLKTAKEKFPSTDVDFRLRPEGKNSYLVWDIKNYENYLIKRAGVWEFQTLMKMSFLSGDEKLFEQFKNIVIDRIQQFNKKELIIKINEMHKKSAVMVTSSGQNIFDLKRSIGGFQTIDYLIQSLIFMNDDLIPDAIGQDQISNLRIIKAKFDSMEKINILIENYTTLKSILISIQNYLNTSNYKVLKDKRSADILANEIGFNDYKDLDNTILKIAKFNYTFLIEIINNYSK
ncbi:Glutamate-ammonia-ligase adenylyltransferase [hydrothermal vent metagenome]|uniref:Glutamate-ammonia-ligase adenylyltransferase n=1 Tax=hydrothermal vent metagenome TaxID=652676 RepID=A0A3B1BZT5_9ZZZZ